MLAFNRLQSRQSIQPDVGFESAIHRSSYCRNKVRVGTNSQININQIPEYKEVRHRQRPQTGKYQRNQSAGQFTSSQKGSVTQMGQGFVVIGQLQSQVFRSNKAVHQRMTSAQAAEDLRITQPSNAWLSNTRDIIQSQSNGLLTTMAGSNNEFTSANCRSRQSLTGQMSASALPSSQAIVRQHYVRSNPAQQRLTSAKAYNLRNSTQFTTNINNKNNVVSRKSAKMKRNSVQAMNMKMATRRLKDSAQQRQALELRGVAKTQQQTQQQILSQQSESSPLPVNQSEFMAVFSQYRKNNGNSNVTSAEYVQTNEIGEDSKDLGSQSNTEAQSDQKPLNLAIVSSAMLNNNQTRQSKKQPQKAIVEAKAIVNSLPRYSGKKSYQRRRNHDHDQGASAHTRTVYKLPDVSQGLLEQNILQRSTEYMSHLYSLAQLREKENAEKEKRENLLREDQMRAAEVARLQQSPPRPRKVTRLEMSPSPELTVGGGVGANETFALSPDFTSADENEMHKQRVSTEQREASSRREHRLVDRSQSLVQLHVKNLQFPFDSQIYGGFSRTKLLEMKFSDKNKDLDCSQNSESIEPNKRRRPQTAGRIRPTPSNIDLFNNKLISQVAANKMQHQRSNEALSNHQMTFEALPNQTVVGTVEGTQSQFPLATNSIVAATDSSKDLLSGALSFHNTANLTNYQLAQLQFSFLTTQFANLMNPDKEHMVMSVVTPDQNGVLLTQSQILNKLLMMRSSDRDQLIKQLNEAPMPVLNQTSNETPIQQHRSSENVSFLSNNYPNSQEKSHKIPQQQLVSSRVTSHSRSRATSPTYKIGEAKVSLAALSQRNSSSRLRQLANIKREDSPARRVSQSHSLTITVTKTNHKKDSVSSYHDTNLLCEDDGAVASSDKDLQGTASIKIEQASNQKDTQAQVDPMMLQDTHDANETPAQQMLLVTDMPVQRMRQIVLSQDASQKTLKNLCKQEKMQPIKIQSIVFDEKGQQIQEKNKNSSPHQQYYYDQQQQQNHSFGPSSSPQSRFLNPYQQQSSSSPSQYRGSLYKNDSRKIQQQMSITPTGFAAGETTVNEHKQFLVTQPIKRRASQAASYKTQERQASIKGHQMKLESVQGRNSSFSKVQSKHLQQKNIQRVDSQSNVEKAKDLLHKNQGEQELFVEAISSKVPPLALPSDDGGTEQINSMLMVSDRQDVQDIAAAEEAKKQVLQSFSKNNVRTNFKGPNVEKLVQGIQFGSPSSFVSDNLLQSSQGQISPLRKHKYLRLIDGHAISNSHTNSFTHNTSSQVPPSEHVKAIGGIIQATEWNEFSKTLTSAMQFPSAETREIKSNKYQQHKAAQNAKNQPKPETVTQRLTDRIDSVSPTLRNKDDTPKDAIIELTEGSQSPQHSRIRVSVSSLRKGKSPSAHAVMHIQNEHLKTSMTGYDEAPSPMLQILQQASQDKLLLNQRSQLSRASSELMEAGAAPLIEKSGITSVYEAERQALKYGIIKPYSGRRRGASFDRQTAVKKHRDQQSPNIDLQQFLIKHMKLDDENYMQIVGIVDQSVDQDQDEKIDEDAEENQDVITSPRELTRLSSLGINFTNVPEMRDPEAKRRVKKKTIKPEQQQDIMTLRGHQQKSHEIFEAAKRLINDARVMKLDTEVINMQLLELLRNKQDTQNLQKMLQQANLELSKGFGGNRVKKLASQHSTISADGDEDPVLTLAPSFTPNSPESTPGNVGQNNAILRYPVVYTGISMSELPSFGVENNYDETENMKKKMKTAAIIDLNQNILKKVDSDSLSQSSIPPVPKVRPNSASCNVGRYKQAQKQQQTQIQAKKQLQPENDWYGSNTSQKLQQSQQMATINEGVEENHLEQPYQATRSNLKSKFHLMSMAQQAGQVQRFKIDFERDRSESPDRIPTVNLQTITPMNPKSILNSIHDGLVKIQHQHHKPQQQTVNKTSTYGFEKAKQVQKQIQIQLVRHAKIPVQELSSREEQDSRSNLLYEKKDEFTQQDEVKNSSILQQPSKNLLLNYRRKSSPKKFIEKAKNQGYVRRSRASTNHFSLTQSLINGTQKKHTGQQ